MLLAQHPGIARSVAGIAFCHSVSVIEAPADDIWISDIIPIFALRADGDALQWLGPKCYRLIRFVTFMRDTLSPARWLQMKESRTSLSACGSM